MHYNNLKFTGHAIAQMFQRKITKDEVRNVIDTGEVIAEYKDDKPYPSLLLLGYSNKRPLHVVFAFDAIEQTGYIVTAYTPDSNLWTEDYKRRT